MLFAIEKLSGADVKMEDDEALLDRYKVELRLSQADSALLQDNFTVALKQLNRTNNVSISVNFQYFGAISEMGCRIVFNQRIKSPGYWKENGSKILFLR